MVGYGVGSVVREGVWFLVRHKGFDTFRLPMAFFNLNFRRFLKIFNNLWKFKMKKA